MRAVDVKMNAVNGGSFAVTAVRRDDRAPRLGQPWSTGCSSRRSAWGSDTPRPYREFEERVFRHRADLPPPAARR